MTAKKEISKTGPAKNDGKKGPGDQLQHNKMTVKYTFERTKEDVENIERVRRHLSTKFFSKYQKADSKIYRDLPDLYLNAVKREQELQLAIDELTAKLDVLEDLRTSFCRILELCTETDQESKPRKKICNWYDTEEQACELSTTAECDGYNTECKDPGYEAMED